MFVVKVVHTEGISKWTRWPRSIVRGGVDRLRVVVACAIITPLRHVMVGEIFPKCQSGAKRRNVVILIFRQVQAVMPCSVDYNVRIGQLGLRACSRPTSSGFVPVLENLESHGI